MRPACNRLEGIGFSVNNLLNNAGMVTSADKTFFVCDVNQFLVCWIQHDSSYFDNNMIILKLGK